MPWLRAGQPPEHDDPMRARPWRVTRDESDHPLPWPYVRMTRHGIEDAGVRRKHLPLACDPVFVSVDSGNDKHAITHCKQWQVVEGVARSDPVGGDGEVSNPARQRGAWHVTGPKSELRQARAFDNRETPVPAKARDLDECEGLAEDGVNGVAKGMAGVGPDNWPAPLAVQLAGKGVLCTACLNAGSPYQVTDKQERDRAEGEAKLSEDAQGVSHL